jgi:gliding motility-associatede transport system auxiliary component
MAANPHPKPSFSPYRKWGIGIHVVVLVLVVLSVVVMVNYISHDYFYRFHLSTGTKLELSPRTVGLLRSLTNRVNVTLYYDTEDEQALYSTVSELLNEYGHVSPKIVLQTVDYVRNPGLALKTKAKYNISGSSDKNLVIFDYQGKIKAVDGNGLASYVTEQVTNQAPNAKGPAFRRKPAAFLGEMAFTAALLDVTSPKPFKAYFLQGHGESLMEGGDQVTGYLKFTSILQQNCIKPEALSLLGTNTVPADCNLLIIAGPQKPISVVELQRIEQYLSQGGRLLALFDFGTATKHLGLETLLSTWGVDVGHNLVADSENSAGGPDVIVTRFGKHPIVESLQGSALQLSLPRSVGKLKGQADAADAPRVEELAFTGPRALAVGDQLRRAPIPLAVAVEKGAIKDVITERGSTRIVVAGDSLFLGNAQIDALANRDFAGNSVNWLLERTHLLAGMGPRPILQYRVVMTQAQLHQSQWVLLGALPGSVLFLGGIVWLRRRR